ncbi:LysM peptidoglycan-binding domain-containing protein [Acinetobacter guillouiae]|uniref:LysM peptidoglycan-binding domain-containing protein n=1 Tax=Acinetobacter guillouiae TaxID=106649 RepID=UPI003AF73E8D
MTNTRKSLITIKVVDLFGSPISKLEYQVKNQRNGEVIAAGPTNSAGCIVEISRDKGTVIDVYIKNMFTGTMVKVQSLVMSKDRMLVKIMSPKVLLDLKTLLDKGSEGQYKRKTHTVKKGETLTSIASQNQTTVRALERLNKIDDPNKISIGQVIKLPVDIPAAGSNSHQDKPKPKATTAPKPKVPQTQTSKNPTKTTQQTKADTGILGTLGDLGNKALEQANDLYEEGKKTFNGAVGSVTKILTVDDRSQDGGTPKSNVPNLCKTNPQCIDKGNSELIREINIRLAGFGGALPTDEFTELTAKCIKQFQKDYMGIQPTGKICGSLIVSLDKFRDEYGISDFFNSMKCPCGKCSGFGKGRSGTFTFESKNKQTGTYVKVQKTVTEPGGMHRSLIWGLKAMMFYFRKMENPDGYKISGISSGYRCVDNNLKKRRATTNHMGTALDIVVTNKKNQTITNSQLENQVRKEWFCKYLNATMGWSPNRFGLERLSDGADTWVHLDVREYSNQYKASKLFSNTVASLNGDYLVNLFRQDSKASTVLGCAGLASASKELVLNDSSLEDLIKQLGSSISHGEGNYDSYNTGTINDKVIHSYLHPAKGTITNKTVNQIIESHSLSARNTNRLFAVGKYQMIPGTITSAKKTLGLSGNEKLDENLQERIFREYLIPTKRPILGDFVLKGIGTAKNAQFEAAKEWASVATPEGLAISKKYGGYISDGTKSYYESKANHANPGSTKMVKQILEKIYQYHQQHKK